MTCFLRLFSLWTSNTLEPRSRENMFSCYHSQVKDGQPVLFLQTHILAVEEWISHLMALGYMGNIAQFTLPMQTYRGSSTSSIHWFFQVQTDVIPLSVRVCVCKTSNHDVTIVRSCFFPGQTTLTGVSADVRHSNDNHSGSRPERHFPERCPIPPSLLEALS